jgi:hypothetical protein
LKHLWDEKKKTEYNKRTDLIRKKKLSTIFPLKFWSIFFDEMNFFHARNIDINRIYFHFITKKSFDFPLLKFFRSMSMWMSKASKEDIEFVESTVSKRHLNFSCAQNFEYFKRNILNTVFLFHSKTIVWTFCILFCYFISNFLVP